MTLHHLDHVWHDSTHRGSALLVLLAIAHNANEAGEGQITIRTLSTLVRVETRQLHYILQRLEGKDAQAPPGPAELTVLRRIGAANVYRLTLPAMATCPQCRRLS